MTCHRFLYRFRVDAPCCARFFETFPATTLPDISDDRAEHGSPFDLWISRARRAAPRRAGRARRTCSQQRRRLPFFDFAPIFSRDGHVTKVFVSSITCNERTNLVNRDAISLWCSRSRNFQQLSKETSRIFRV